MLELSCELEPQLADDEEETARKGRDANADQGVKQEVRVKRIKGRWQGCLVREER